MGRLWTVSARSGCAAGGCGSACAGRRVNDASSVGAAVGFVVGFVAAFYSPHWFVFVKHLCNGLHAHRSAPGRAHDAVDSLATPSAIRAAADSLVS